jgi:ABC-type amino acid transport substrate-binding protein
MTKTTTIAAAAVAALALPVGASAAKPEKPAKAAKAPKTQKVGWSASGTTAAAPAAGATSFDIDLAKASAHALRALQLKKADLKKTETSTITDAVAGFKLVFEDGVTAATFNPATDRVRLIGKVERTRTAKAPKATRFTYGAVDVRKVVVSRPGADD